MPHSSAHPLGAGRAPSGQPGRRPKLSPADLLDQLSARLDDLTRDVRFIPARSHHEVDRRIAEAEDIAGGIRNVFRSTATPEHPPLKREGSGAWW